METLLYAAPIVGVLALLCAWWLATWIFKNNTGTDRLREISSYIREGAMAFLLREYRTIIIFGIAMFLILTFAIGIGIALTL